jgi:hypothetical protein
MQELTPVELIEVAAEAGFERVCIFVSNPTADQGLTFPLFTAANVKEVRSRLASTGVMIHNLEIFFLTPDVDVEKYRFALELGAALGGRRATAIIADPDDGRAAQNFARFCDLVGELGIKAGIEFMVFSAVKTAWARNAYYPCRRPSKRHARARPASSYA